MRRLTGLLAAALLLVACSGEAAEEATSTTQAATTTTTREATTTTTTPPTTTTTSPATATTIVDELGPEGSGCTPGTATLPDGEWYGGVRGFDEQGIVFDLACLFTGDAAIEAAAEDEEESPPPNDYYVRNENDEVRALAVAADTPVTWYPSGDPDDEVTGTYAEWIGFLATQESYLGIWVTVEGGTVTEIAEWWVP